MGETIVLSSALSCEALFSQLLFPLLTSLLLAAISAIIYVFSYFIISSTIFSNISYFLLSSLLLSPLLSSLIPLLHLCYHIHSLWELYTIAPNFHLDSAGCLRRNHKIHQLGLNYLQSRNGAYFSPERLISSCQKNKPFRAN